MSETKQTGETKKKLKKDEIKEVEDGDSLKTENQANDIKPSDTVKKGLFEQPVVMQGKRERKKVERLSAVQLVGEPKHKKEVTFVDGKGTALGEIPYISTMLGKFHSDDMNILHRCLFDANTTRGKIKQNIRKFNGFDFEKGTKDYTKRDELLNRAYWPVITKQFVKLLGVDKDKSGKDETVKKILEFLTAPYDHGKKIQQKKKKGAKTSRKSKSKLTTKDSKTKKTPVEGDVAAESSSDEDDSGAESGSGADADEASSTTPKKETPKKKENKDDIKKKKKTPTKKTATKKDNKKDKPPTKRKTPSKKAEKRSVELSTDTSDDEPLMKKSKEPPTDPELKQAIQKILDGANLEQVTMKTVCQAVYSKFPDFDLTQRKDFIKSTVRELIN